MWENTEPLKPFAPQSIDLSKLEWKIATIEFKASNDNWHNSNSCLIFRDVEYHGDHLMAIPYTNNSPWQASYCFRQVSTLGNVLTFGTGNMILVGGYGNTENNALVIPLKITKIL